MKLGPEDPTMFVSYSPRLPTLLSRSYCQLMGRCNRTRKPQLGLSQGEGSLSYGAIQESDRPPSCHYRGAH